MLIGLLKIENRRIVAWVAGLVVLITISFNVHSQSSPPYSVYWINPLRVNINGSILTKGQYPNTWIAGAISSNLLDPNTDGWMEFASVAGAHYILGLAYNNIYDVDQFSYAIFIDQANNYYAAYEGTAITGLGACQIGDVFKIAREGNVVNYYRNDVVVRTVTVNPATILQIKASIRYAGKSTPFINTSFDGRLILQGAVNGLENDSELGGISMNVSGGTSTYSYNWSSGEQGNSISNKTVGS
jgi:hypothetical protein